MNSVISPLHPLKFKMEQKLGIELVKSISQQDMQRFRNLMKNPKLNVNFITNGRTPLIVAVRRDNLYMVKNLLEKVLIYMQKTEIEVFLKLPNHSKMFIII